MEYRYSVPLFISHKQTKGGNMTYIEQLEENAKQGNVHALYAYAGYLRRGTESCDKDVARAMRYYNEAAEKGCCRSLTMLAESYWYGQNGCGVDRKRSIDLFIKAAELGGVTEQKNYIAYNKQGEEMNELPTIEQIIENQKLTPGEVYRQTKGLPFVLGSFVAHLKSTKKYPAVKGNKDLRKVLDSSTEHELIELGEYVFMLPKSIVVLSTKVKRRTADMSKYYLHFAPLIAASEGFENTLNGVIEYSKRDKEDDFNLGSGSRIKMLTKFWPAPKKKTSLDTPVAVVTMELPVWEEAKISVDHPRYIGQLNLKDKEYVIISPSPYYSPAHDFQCGEVCGLALEVVSKEEPSGFYKVKFMVNAKIPAKTQEAKLKNERQIWTSQSTYNIRGILPFELDENKINFIHVNGYRRYDTLGKNIYHVSPNTYKNTEELMSLFQKRIENMDSDMTIDAFHIAMTAGGENKDIVGTVSLSQFKASIIIIGDLYSQILSYDKESDNVHIKL
jgi:hypothetical protein